MSLERTRQSIHGQITDELARRGIAWEWVTVDDGRQLYRIAGATMTPGEAADAYLPGGFAANFGGNGR